MLNLVFDHKIFENNEELKQLCRDLLTHIQNNKTQLDQTQNNNKRLLGEVFETYKKRKIAGNSASSSSSSTKEAIYNADGSAVVNDSDDEEEKGGSQRNFYVEVSREVAFEQNGLSDWPGETKFWRIFTENVKVNVGGQNVVLLNPIQFAAAQNADEALEFLFDKLAPKDAATLCQEPITTNFSANLKQKLREKKIRDDKEKTIDGMVYVAGSTALHLAASNASANTLKLLLDRRSYYRHRTDQENFLQVTDVYGNSPLHNAVLSKHPETELVNKVRLLIDNGADVNAQNTAKQTPWQLAQTRRQESIFAHLENEFSPKKQNDSNTADSSKQNDSSTADSSSTQQGQFILAQAMDKIIAAQKDSVLLRAFKDTHYLSILYNRLLQLDKILQDLNDELEEDEEDEDENEVAFSNSSTLSPKQIAFKEVHTTINSFVIEVIDNAKSKAENKQIVAAPDFEGFKQKLSANLKILSNYSLSKKILILAIIVGAILIAITGVGLAAEIAGVGFAVAAKAAFTGAAITIAGETVVGAGIMSTVLTVGGVGGAVATGYAANPLYSYVKGPSAKPFKSTGRKLERIYEHSTPLLAK